MSPMQRTLAVLKERNQKYWVVEVWKQWAKRRVDLFNIIDLIVLDGGIVGYQICGSDWKAHYRKIMEGERENTIAWLKSKGRLEVWGWRKLRKKRGGKAMKWVPRIADVILINNELYWEER